MAATKTANTAKTDTTQGPGGLDYAEGGKLAERWLTLDRACHETKERDPFDGQILGPKAPLTVERYEALRRLWAWWEAGR